MVCVVCCAAVRFDKGKSGENCFISEDGRVVQVTAPRDQPTAICAESWLEDCEREWSLDVTSISPRVGDALFCGTNRFIQPLQLGPRYGNVGRTAHFRYSGLQGKYPGRPPSLCTNHGPRLMECEIAIRCGLFDRFTIIGRGAFRIEIRSKSELEQ